MLKIIKILTTFNIFESGKKFLWQNSFKCAKFFAFQDLFLSSKTQNVRRYILNSFKTILPQNEILAQSAHCKF